MRFYNFSFGILQQNENEGVFHKKNEYKSDLDIFRIVVKAKEFQNIKLRIEEILEVGYIIKQFWFYDGSPPDTTGLSKFTGPDKKMEEVCPINEQDKMLALFLGYVLRVRYETYSLTIDQQFLIQNSSRLLRCLLEMCMKKSMAFNVELLLKCCKMLENRVAPGETALR